MAAVNAHCVEELEEFYVTSCDVTASRHFQVISLLARGHTSMHAGPSSYKCEGDATDTPIAARTAKIDARYLCGNGSFNPPHAFKSASAIQPFPGSNTDGYAPNISYYTH